jgi:hypothetical protein
MNVKDFLKVVSEQIQRLNEIQPQVADTVIKAYNLKFKDEPPTISRPEITNGLVDIKIYEEEKIEVPPPSPAPVLSPPPANEIVPITAIEKKKPAFK